MYGSEIITASNGQEILVDSDTYRWLKAFRWHIRNGYATSGGRLMHRIVMDAPSNMLVDHKNRNRRDNRRCNLRLATPTQNNCNMPLVPNGSKAAQYRGVAHCCRRNKRREPKKPWRAVIKTESGKRHLGYFATQLEAAIAYDNAATRYHGEFATLNFQTNST